MIKQFTIVLGVVFLATGIMGWLSGGHDHELIIFGINMTHNLVHILSGAVAVIAGLSGIKFAKMYCLIFGAVYGLVTLAGFLGIPQVVSLLNLNMADNFLHLGITAACLYFGVTTKA